MYDLLKQALASLPSGTVVVGASGGGDSQSLLVALGMFRPDIRVIALYCNHGLRDSEAIEQDQRVIGHVAREWGMRFISRRIPVQQHVIRTRMGIEEAGRLWRYRVLGHVARLHQAVAILTAHHLDDVAETVLLQLIRGTRTVSSMGESNPWLIRPFRCIPKSYLESFQVAVGFPYVTDMTNFDTMYSRSKLRHNVLPILREMNPQMGHHLLAFSDYLFQLHQGIEHHFQMDRWVKIAETWVEISIDYWELHVGIRSHLNRVLFKCLAISESFISQFDSCYTKLGTRKWVGDWSMTVTSTHVYLCRICPLPSSVDLPLRVGQSMIVGPFSIQVHDSDYPTSKTAVLLDRSYFPSLRVSPRSPGLRYHPVGYPSPIGLKSFLTNHSLFPPIRQSLPLFFSGDELIWVPYVRRSVLLSCASSAPDWVVVSVSFLDSSLPLPNPSWPRALKKPLKPFQPLL